MGCSSGRGRLVPLMLAAALVNPCLAPCNSAAAAYPDRPVRVIVPFPPGGGTDVVGRVLSEKLSEIFNKQFVVENRPGAGAMLGADLVAKAAPDGYTILIGTSAELTISPALFSAVPYQPAVDFAAIALVGVSPVILLAHPTFPGNDLRDVIALHKASPARYSVASGGSGAAPHLAAELFRSLAAKDITIVPYKGAADSLRDLIGGQVDLGFSTIASALPQVVNKSIKALVVTSPRRSTLLPDVPTSVEQGLAELEAVTWFGLFVPAAVPPDVAGALRAATARALADRVVQQRLQQLAVEIGSVEDGGDVLTRRIMTELERWKRVVHAAGIPVQ
jgi:tripartite-type tricarboxylate transporter receptor subunit TctC